MHQGKRRLLSPEEQERVIECVKEVERNTSGEIVPMVVRASYHYPLAGVLGALLAALGLAILAGAWVTIRRGWGETYTVYDLWVFPAVFAAGFLILLEVLRRAPALKRVFIAPEEMEEEVAEAALTSFYRRGLDKTRDRTGVLIFVSVYERRVQVLADSGIHAKVNPAVWEEIVGIVSVGIREGRQAEALCRAVRRCGELLCEHFPCRRDDRGADAGDELDNLIIEE